MSRVLVVANETVEAEELLAELRRIEDEHSSTFLVVAPAVAAEHGLGTWSQAGAIEAAQERLDRTLAVLRGEGLDCDGWVGDMVPFAAVRDALDRFDADDDRDLDPPGDALGLAAQGSRRSGAQHVRRPGRARRLARARAARRLNLESSGLHAGRGAVDDRDGAAATAAPQALEPLGDAVEIGQVRDDVGQLEPPVGCELHERGELGRRVAAAVVAALDALVGEELDGRERGLDADRGEARRRRRCRRRAGSPTRAASSRGGRRPRRRGRRRRPVSSRTSAAGSPARASTACVAPRASESSSIAGSRSTATIVPAPASTRPAMTCWPTPPQPTTAALSPMRGRATLRTAPMPVTAPQPSSAACHSGTPAGSGTTPRRRRRRARRSRRP